MQSAGIERRFLSPQTNLDNKKLKSSSIKFNRKPQGSKTDKKKVESPKEGSERIVFISPNKQSGIASQVTSNNSSNISKVRQSFIGPKDESYILPRESPLNNDHKMNDSMLSLMQELGASTQRKYQSDMQDYLQLISSLRDEVDRLHTENNVLKGKVKDIQMIQEFLIERETYISEVTDRNINLNEQLHCIQVANERLRGQLRQLQEDYDNQHQMYESYIATLKQQKEAVKTELDTVMALNLELNEKLQEKSIKKGQRFKRVFRDKNEQIGEISPKRLTKQAQETLRSHRSLFKNDFSQLVDTCQTAKSKQTDFSQLNVKSMDEYSILQKLNEPEPCDCTHLIKNLKQKIRYSEIQIDILKRIKVNGEKTKQDNQKLKNQNRKLLCKLDHFSSQKQRKEKRSTHSDSSLELSLSPSKGEHQIKKKK